MNYNNFDGGLPELHGEVITWWKAQRVPPNLAAGTDQPMTARHGYAGPQSGFSRASYSTSERTGGVPGALGQA